jgi:hypothetical protein
MRKNIVIVELILLLLLIELSGCIEFVNDSDSNDNNQDSKEDIRTIILGTWYDGNISEWIFLADGTVLHEGYEDSWDIDSRYLYIIWDEGVTIQYRYTLLQENSILYLKSYDYGGMTYTLSRDKESKVDLRERI